MRSGKPWDGPKQLARRNLGAFLDAEVAAREAVVRHRATGDVPAAEKALKRLEEVRRSIAGILARYPEFKRRKRYEGI